VKILFITAHPYLPQMHGGLQNSTDQLCRCLRERGHKVAVLCALTPGGWFGWRARIVLQIGKRLRGRKAAKDNALGYPVWRAWFPWEAVAEVAKCEKPDVIVVMAMRQVRMALAARPLDVPLLMQIQDAEFRQHDGDFGQLGKAACVANSRFTADKYREAFGVDPAVIHPFIDLDKYKTDTTRGNVTFINPVSEKGVEVALALARLYPEIPFSFVEAWPLTPDRRAALTQALASLPNVTLMPPQDDMRKIYGGCKILLAPSVWEEAYGRVITEAGVSGIPSLASTRGGLPEAVGPGGVLLDPTAPVENWAAALRRLWNDRPYYDAMAAAARAHAWRPENTLSYKIDLWERALRHAAGTASL